MIERTIYDILTDGLAWFQADTRRVVSFYVDHCGIPAAEAGEIETYFKAHPPNIVIGYPRGSGPFPAWAIILESDSIRDRFIGDQGEYAPDDEPEYTDEDGELAEKVVMRVSARYGVYTYSLGNPDVALLYYKLLRQILLKNIDTLIANEVGDLDFSGADMAPDPRYLPEDMWVRRLSLTLDLEETAWEAKPKGASVTATVTGVYTT